MKIYCERCQKYYPDNQVTRVNKGVSVAKYFYRYLCDSCFIVEEKEIEEERKKMTWGEQAKETINKQPQLFPKDKFEFKEAEESDTTQYI